MRWPQKGVVKLIHDNTSHAAIPYIAEKKGFYKAEGVEVQRRVTSPRALIDALIGGTADIISTRGSRVGQMRRADWTWWASRSTATETRTWCSCP